MTDFEEIGKEFLSFYYDTFDNNREGLADLYQEESMLTYNGEQFKGQESIVNKLAGLKFNSIQHQLNDYQSHPSLQDSVLVSACGTIFIDNNENGINFSQVFLLAPVQGSNSYFIYNDIFSLNLN
ncbi:hypothetical protein M0813_03202 [Anaeramoeba flamelloides]|uniref:Nuclear transport factor 2 n=1 Tax=Anaeramoeba flamelloides TaxID=1746091 RepID=A0ABQ8Y064_9EUKA|nr:hypothetical protein M0813_03202 [Anaeramoeba flamelloides]